MNADAIMHSLSAPADAVVEVPGLQTRTEGNARELWQVAAKRAKAQRGATALACARWLRYRGHVAVVRVTRISPRSLDPQNLASACKHVVDGVADVVSPIRHTDKRGRDCGDDSPRAGIEWQHAQERGPTGMRIELWRRAK